MQMHHRPSFPFLFFLNISSPSSQTKQTPYAGLYPDIEQLERFAAHLPPPRNTNYHAVLQAFNQESRLDGQFFFCNLDALLYVAEQMSKIPVSNC
jgi:hypothetical protein